MGYRRCASCGHEVFDHDATVCPFCGAEKGRPAPGAAPSGRRGCRTMVMTALALLAIFAGGIHRFLEDRADDVNPSHVHEAPADSAACVRNLREVLESELDQQAGIEAGTLTKEEIERLRAGPSWSCPVTGESYRVDFGESTVTVTCPTHGTFSREW